MLKRLLSSRRVALYGALFAIFLSAAVVTGVALAAGTAVRSYVSGNVFLTLNKVKTGFVKSVGGGAISAEVINEPSGPSYFVKKHIGQPKYEDFTAEIGFSMTKAVYDWIAQSWNMSAPRKSGSFTYLDFNLNPVSQIDFTNALLTETTIPACDGSSKEPAYITIKFSPEATRTAKPSAGKYDEYGKNEQKIWLPSNFNLSIDGLDCTKVSKIDSFAVKQTAVTDDIGDARDALKEPGKLEFPDLKITLAEVTAKSWYDWHNDFVLKGNNDESKEKNGVLTFLNPNRTAELAKIELHNLGIYRIEAGKAEANADQIKRVTAYLYCERMVFSYLNKVISDNSTPSTKSDNVTVASTDSLW